MALDFGALADSEVSTQTFTITNVGPEETVLNVSDVHIGGEDGGFTILTGEVAFSLMSGESAEIEVVFTPVGANAQVGEAIVDSDDEDEAKVIVELSGEGMVPELEIDPDPLDLGETYVGCTRSNEITLTNVGTDLLTIESLEHSGDGFIFQSSLSFPLDLAPGESEVVNLLFGPAEEKDYTGELTAVSNEPLGTRVATQTGTGIYAAEYTDSFEVPTDPPSDILFFVDQSCSMDDDQASLAGHFTDFITELSNYTTDWQIIVANDDDGCNNSGILKITTVDYEGKFSDAVRDGGGIYTEAGLTVGSRAIDKTDAGECNSGFMRTDAMLHLIMVSDEPEQSFGSWTNYVNDIITKKGDSSLVKISAVAGDYPGGCSSGSNSAEPGTGYYDAVNYTGGEFLSICSNWSTHVQTLADASIVQDTYALTREPIPDTIVVSVNGTVRANGWSYDTINNAVVFSSNVPEEGDVIDVSYAGLASCD